MKMPNIQTDAIVTLTLVLYFCESAWLMHCLCGQLFEFNKTKLHIYFKTAYSSCDIQATIRNFNTGTDLHSLMPAGTI